MDLLVLYGIMNEGTINVLGSLLSTFQVRSGLTWVEHYFEMSKYDAQRALTIYKTFTKQTNMVVEFLGTARQYENATRLEIPKLKHAPTSLTSSLEEYLNDADFEVNRRQYLAHQQAKKDGKPLPSSTDTFKKPNVNSGSASKPELESKPGQKDFSAPLASKSPAPDLIDFFESIEQNQQPMAVQHQQSLPQIQNPQQKGFLPEQNFYSQNGQQLQAPQQNGTGFGNTNPFGPPVSQQLIQQDGVGIGAGFGGYASQQYPQQQQQQQQLPHSHPQDMFTYTSQTTGSSFPSQQQPFSTGQTSFASSQQPFMTGQSQAQSTNPFRQSMYPQGTGTSMPDFQASPPIPYPQSPQSTNPFGRSGTMPLNNQNTSSPFTSHPPQPPHQPAVQQLQPQRTGTNPFARTTPQTPQSQPPAQSLVASQTGTNPFRQTLFGNQQTGQGWQSGQGTIGGLEQLPTVPVFPRVGQQQQQQQQSPWG
ncbi:uncharacterized protein KY384_001962 [Bacidia gigantensis]|uniref:uncharacterized protein n=1 Tax=Bacidia gigantensis TaxID=2732470 RepID=UPI001D055B18|nr:uncharacterized protein KY384_001962 [Bacidia gigantensis]KAG8533179.1 hypothetical protein KY384_001962 [Bacidia gigantensis]